mmetsp:Transcript_2127/g.5736  ORF Transcript_2127/g.5736 Transcript_2127/m.5736 type:complete len:205 (-) Transcript_2127:1086-1700(-)
MASKLKSKAQALKTRTAKIQTAVMRIPKKRQRISRAQKKVRRKKLRRRMRSQVRKRLNQQKDQRCHKLRLCNLRLRQSSRSRRQKFRRFSERRRRRSRRQLVCCPHQCHLQMCRRRPCRSSRRRVKKLLGQLRRARPLRREEEQQVARPHRCRHPKFPSAWTRRGFRRITPATRCTLRQHLPKCCALGRCLVPRRGTSFRAWAS